MGSGVCYYIVFFHTLLLFQCLSPTSSRDINKGHLHTRDQNTLQMSTKHKTKYDHNPNQDHFNHHHRHHSLPHAQIDPNDPQLQVFFTINDLKMGKKLPIYFPIKEPSTIPPLLSKEEADTIPFSSTQLPNLLKLFSFSDVSPQANAMESTLQHCEFSPMKGESKFCATSIESLLDSLRDIFGSSTKFKVVTTKHLTKNIKNSIFQNFTILEKQKEISTRRIIGCHMLPYPYAVYYCHSQESDNKLYKVSLLGENGGRIEAAAMCHMDTSQWNQDHVAFLVLKTKPGKSPVCHFFPADNLVWVPSSSGSI